MLRLGEAAFTSGSAGYFDQIPGAADSPDARIYVKIEPRGLGAPILAMLDTGAPWCILDPEIAEALGVSTEEPGEELLRTKNGRVKGRLECIFITLLADQGESLELNATVFLPNRDEGWKGPAFIGYAGLLQRIRFAVDPSTNSFYFGPLD